jgi:ribosomal protein S18 acetylase RimI-like enzyme
VLRAGDAALECHLVPWDTAIFGFAVADVTRLDLGATGSSADDLFAVFDDWCAGQAVRLASCRLDHLRLRESMELEAHGFRFVEMIYEPLRAVTDPVAAPRHPIRVREATGDDLPAIEAIAASAFSTGRYLLDHRLPPDLSHRRYRAWVRSSFAGAEQTVLAAELDGELVGFFIVEHRPDGHVYWHLTAIATGWQGRGIGQSLWQTMLLRHAAEGASTVQTTISAHNLAVLNMYARLGFSFPSARMTFHRLAAAST